MSDFGTFSCNIDFTVDIVDNTIGFVPLSIMARHFSHTAVVLVMSGHIVLVFGLYLWRLGDVLGLVDPYSVSKGAHESYGEALSHFYNFKV